MHYICTQSQTAAEQSLSHYISDFLCMITQLRAVAPCITRQLRTLYASSHLMASAESVKTALRQGLQATDVVGRLYAKLGVATRH